MTKWEEYRDLDEKIYDKTEDWGGSLESYEEAFLEYHCFKNTKEVERIKNLAVATLQMYSILDGDWFGDEVELRLNIELLKLTKEIFNNLSIEEQEEVLSRKEEVLETIEYRHEFEILLDIDEEFSKVRGENNLSGKLYNLVDEIDEKNLSHSDRVKEFVKATMSLADELDANVGGNSKIIEDILEKGDKEKEKTR